MKYAIIYLLVSIFLTFFAYVYNPFVTTVNKALINNIVFVSRPVVNLLDYVKELSDNYILLFDLKKENMALKRKILALKIKNSMLENRKCDNKAAIRKENIFKAKFKFKNNFNIDYIFLYVKGKPDLSDNNCSVFSKNMNLVGIVYKKENGGYIAKTVFNHSFVADSYIVSDNKTYRALFIGDLYRPKAEFLTPNAKIKPGSYVYASGEFNVFPKGSLIGKVTDVANINNYYKIAYVSIDKGFFNDWDLFVICIKKH